MKTPHHRNSKAIDALQQVKEAIRNEYAWPGGYPLSIICNDGAAICPNCAKANWHSIAHDTLKGWRTGWDVAGAQILWEGGNCCEQCNANLDAYPADEEMEVGS
jgi:hypothetical protein